MSERHDLQFLGTTILCIRKNGKVAIAGDGQITLGHTVLKRNAKKSDGCITTASLPGFQAQQPMHSHFLKNSRLSLKLTGAI